MDTEIRSKKAFNNWSIYRLRRWDLPVHSSSIFENCDCRQSLTQANMSWRDRFSDVTFVEYTLTAMSHYSMIAWCSLLLKETRWKWFNYLLSSPHMERCVGVAHSLNCGLLNNYFSLLFLCVCVCIEAPRMCVPQYQDHDNHHKQTTNGNCNNWVRHVTCGMCGMQLITIGTDTHESRPALFLLIISCLANVFQQIPFALFLFKNVTSCFSTESIIQLTFTWLWIFVLMFVFLFFRLK